MESKNIGTDSLLQDKNFLLGKLNYENNSFFARIPDSLTTKTEAYLAQPVLEAFIKMYNHALKDNIRFVIVSAARNFDRQKQIWEDKWFGRRLVGGKDLGKSKLKPEEKAKAIMKYSAMPGTSRHHWGTDIDINSLEDNYFLSGKGKAEYEWLCRHASQYGFCQVYSSRTSGRITGYEEEKWHWSYMPLSNKILKYYNQLINYSDLSGFAGSDNAALVKAIDNYVNGISIECSNLNLQ